MNFQRWASNLLMVFKVGMTWKKTNWKSDHWSTINLDIPDNLAKKLIVKFFLEFGWGQGSKPKKLLSCMITWTVYDYYQASGRDICSRAKGLHDDHVAKDDLEEKDLLFSEKCPRFWSGCPCKTNENSKLECQCNCQVFAFLESIKISSSVCCLTSALTWQSHKNLSLI